MRQSIGEAITVGVQGLVVRGIVLFVQSFGRNMAGLCARKDQR